MNTSRAFAALLVSVAALPAFAQTTGFNQTGAGPWDYDTTANWVGNTVSGVWDSSLTLTATQAVTFDSDLVLSTGLNFGYAGNLALTLRGDGTNRNITLGGDITVATTGGTTANVTLGSSTSGQNLNINLGGVTRTMSVVASRTLTLTNVISNGSILKTGAGTLTLSGANTFADGITLSDGILSLGNNAALGTGALTITGGSINVSAARTTTNNNAQNWNGDFTFVGGNTWNTGTGAVTLGGNRIVTTTASTMTVGGAIGDGSQGYSLTKEGAGTLVLNGANTYSGGTIINAGILQFGTGSLPATGSVTVNSAGVVTSSSSLSGILSKITAGSTGTLALSGNSSENLDFTGHDNLFLGATTASTYSGTLTASGNTYRLGNGSNTLTVSSALTGSGNSLVVGQVGSTATVILTAANTYTGGTTLNAGALSFSGANGSAASSAVTANAGTTLNFDSSTDGITGATRAASVNLRGATLNILGNNTSNSVDTITGALTADAPSTFGGAGANTVTLTAQSGANTRLSSNNLTRANNGAVFFRGTNLGVNTIASNTAGASNIEFTGTTPTLVGGGGGAGSQNISIIPWAIGAATATGAPTGFVTYDAANGIRVLSSSEYDTTIPAAASTNNVKLDAASPVVANGATTINSLFLKNAASSATVLSGTGALTITSGAIYADLSLGGNNNATTISKAIDFGTAQGVIGTQGTSSSKTLSFTGGISGSGGLMIYDTGITSSTQAGVSLGATSYTGDTIINGSVIATNTNSLANFTNGGRTGDVYVNGTLGLANNNSSVRINGLWGNGRIITPFSSNTTLIVGDNNATSTFSGTITQTTGAVSLTKVGTGTLTLSGTSSTWTGATNIQNGTLSAITLNSVAAPATSSSLGRPVSVGNGTIGLGSSTTTGNLKLTGTGETTDRVINLAGTTGGGGIEQAGTGLLKFTSSFTATGNGIKTLTLSGSTAGTGEIAGAIVNSTAATSVTKTGTGTWTLSGANTYSGSTTVNAGTLNLDTAGSLTFYIGINGVTNSVTGTGTVNFNGSFNFNLTGAALVDGNSWTIVNNGSLTESFAGSFAVNGFTESGNVWTNGSGLSFSEATGILTYSAVPEPSSFALLAGAACLMLVAGRRNRRAS